MTSSHETVGDIFQPDLLQKARDVSLRALNETAKLIKPGMTEADARRVLTKIQADLGAPKSWHGPQLRFGENTLLSFGEKSRAGITLKENDIFFLDIGPLFESHEGDVGRPFVLGNDPEMKKCCEDAEAIWNEVRDHWKKTGATGAELYEFATAVAEKKGWVLILKGASGHRVADFPHTARKRGNVAKMKAVPAADRWILEIQIRHPTRPFGAFFEDLLN